MVKKSKKSESFIYILSRTIKLIKKEKDMRSNMFGLTVVMVILIFLVATGELSCLNSPEETQIQEEPQKEELKLSDFPDVFKEDTLIVIGDNASRITKESAEAIASQFENLTGNKPIINNDTTIVGDNKTGYNLILVGTHNSTSLLQEVYNLTNATKVTEEYLGSGTGILEILRNPWNEDKAMLLIVGSDEDGMVAGINELYWLHLSKKNFENSQGDIITVVGDLKMPMASWSPFFDECFSPSPFIEVNSTIYYLANICPYLNLLSGENLTGKNVMVTTEELQLLGKTVKAKGKHEKREVEVTLRKEQKAPTKIEVFDVIVVLDLKVLNESIIGG